MIERIRVIAMNTLRETLRDRILRSTLIFVVALLFFTLFIGSISIEQDVRMIMDFGVSTIFLLQVFVAIFIGSMLIYKEIDRRTFFLIIPKPIRREEIILGKCLGLSMTIIVITLISTGALAAILAANGAASALPGVLLAIALGTLESVLLILLSILFSGLTSPILSAVYTFAFFLIGHSSQILSHLIASAESDAVRALLKFAYYILPNLEKLNVRNTVVYGVIPEFSTVILAIAYAVFYGALLFALARLMFSKKDF